MGNITSSSIAPAPVSAYTLAINKHDRGYSKIIVPVNPEYPNLSVDEIINRINDTLILGQTKRDIGRRRTTKLISEYTSKIL
jgi:hypothetical protein